MWMTYHWAHASNSSNKILIWFKRLNSVAVRTIFTKICKSWLFLELFLLCVTQQSNLSSEVSASKRQVCTLRRLLQTGFKKVFGIAADVLLLKLRTRNRTVSSFTEGFLFSKVARMSSCIAEKVVWWRWKKKLLLQRGWVSVL